MAIRRTKTDYQLIAETHGVSVWTVKQAIKLRATYPNNRLVKAYDKLQVAKRKALKQLKAA